MFMSQLDAAVVALALPAISRTFHVAPVNLTIGITVYLLALVVLLPIGSWIADRFGARSVFVAAVIAFTIASVLCGVSRSLPEFVGARILQGCAGAFMAPVGRILLLQSTDKEDLVSVMTISTVPMLLAPSLGPALGGFITTYLSWQWIFLLNIPFGIACAALALRLIPRALPVQRRPFDLVGYLSFAGCITCVLYALQRFGDEYPHWQAPLALLVVGVFAGIFALRHSRTHLHPIISLAAMDIPSFAIAALRGGSLIRLPVRALPFLLPMMFQLAFGFSALKAGILMLALNGGDLILKFATTRTLKRFGFRSVLLWTTLLSAVTTAGCALFSASTPFSILFAVLLMSGMFRSLLFTGLSTLVFADVPPAELSSASIVWNIVQQGTNVVGVSLSAILLGASAQFLGETRNQLSLQDFRFALWVWGAIALTALFSLRRLTRDAGSSISGHEPFGNAPRRA